MNEAESHFLLLRADALFSPKFTPARRKGWRAIWLNPGLHAATGPLVQFDPGLSTEAQSCVLANLMMLAVYQTLLERKLALLCPIKSFDRCFPRKVFGKKKAVGRDSLSMFLKAASENPEAGIHVDWGQHMRKGGAAATSVSLSAELRERLFQEFLRLIAKADPDACAALNNGQGPSAGQVLLKKMRLKRGQEKERGVIYGKTSEFADKNLPATWAHRQDHLEDFNKLIGKTKFHIDAFASQKNREQEQSALQKRREMARQRYEETRMKSKHPRYDEEAPERKTTQETEHNRGIRCMTDNFTSKGGILQLESTLFRMNRIFNGCWQYGGRYYSQFSSFERWYRPGLLIDGHPVVELDFKCLHPTILYHRQGLALPQAPRAPSPSTFEGESAVDLYTLLSGDRTANKKALNAALNSLSREEAKKSLLDRRAAKVGQYEKLFFLPPDFSSVDEFLDAMHDVYRPIAPFFFQAPWKQLQFIDSEIAKFVMRCLQLQGIPFVCLHDSFLVPAPKKEALRTAMATGYRTAMLVHFGPKAAEFTPIIEEKTFQ